MGITQFPHGISSMGVPILGNSNDIIAGNAYFVCSVASNSWIAGENSSSSGDKDTPFASIDYAISKCTANKDDHIFVLPGHTETITTAGGITADVAGITIKGLGNGIKRPIVTIATDATNAHFLVSADNVHIDNIQFQNAIDSLVKGVSITGAGCKITRCDFTSPTATNDALIWILTTTAANDLTITDCTFRQNNAGPTECIRLVGADRAKILNNYITGSYSTAAINGITTASLELLIVGNCITNSVIDKLAIDLVAACTGRIEYNNGTVVSTAGISDAAIIDAASCQLAQNYFSDAVGETGKLIGTVSA